MKRRAIIVDLDGTLCDNTHRAHLYTRDGDNDWDEINKQSLFDIANPWCKEIIDLFAMQNYKIIFLTGRDKRGWDQTHEWLTRNIGYGVDWMLLMREVEDKREDTEQKKETFFKEIAPLYDVLFAIDDRISVTHMWRDIGVTCLACAENT